MELIAVEATGLVIRCGERVKDMGSCDFEEGIVVGIRRDHGLTSVVVDFDPDSDGSRVVEVMPVYLRRVRPATDGMGKVAPMFGSI